MSEEIRICHKCKEIKNILEDFHLYRPKVCKKCHSAESQKSKKKALLKKDFDKERVCSKCNLTKPADQFYKTTSNKYCKRCHDLQTIECAKKRSFRLRVLEAETKELRKKYDAQQQALIDSLQDQVRLLKLNETRQTSDGNCQ